MELVSHLLGCCLCLLLDSDWCWRDVGGIRVAGNVVNIFHPGQYRPLGICRHRHLKRKIEGQDFGNKEPAVAGSSDVN